MYHRWLQQGREGEDAKYRQFWQAVKDAEREAEVRAVAMVQKHMANNWQAAMTYLERKFPGGGHARFGAFRAGTHDDLVTALGLAVEADKPMAGFMIDTGQTL